MAHVEGRRTDETSTPQSQRRGAETWMLTAAMLLLVAAVAALVAFALR